MMNRKTGILILLALTALTSGCGQVAYRENDPGNTAQPQGGSGGTPFAGGTTTGTTGGTTGTGTGTTTGTTSTAPAYQFNFVLNGNAMVGSAMSYTVSTDSVLKVTVKAGAPLAPIFTNMATNGYTGYYNCEQVTVSALGQQATVLVTNVGYDIPQGSGPCGGALQAATVDFSARLGQGHNTVNVVVGNAMTDNCRQYYYPNSGGCILNTLYESSTSYYRAAGSLVIATHN